MSAAALWRELCAASTGARRLFGGCTANVENPVVDQQGRGGDTTCITNCDGTQTTCTAKCTDFAALQEGADQINDLDAGRENLRRRGLVHERRGLTMNGIIFVGLHGALFVHGVAGDVENAAEVFFAHGNGDGAANVDDVNTALETFGAGHGDGTNPAVANRASRFCA